MKKKNSRYSRKKSSRYSRKKSPRYSRKKSSRYSRKKTSRYSRKKTSRYSRKKSRKYKKNTYKKKKYKKIIGGADSAAAPVETVATAPAETVVEEPVVEEPAATAPVETVATAPAATAPVEALGATSPAVEEPAVEEPATSPSTGEVVETQTSAIEEGPLYNEKEKALLKRVDPELGGRGSYCHKNKYGMGRNKSDCDDRDIVCKWGSDDKGNERCMKDEDKIRELKLRPTKIQMDSLRSCDNASNEYNCGLKDGCKWGIKEGEVDEKCHETADDIETYSEKREFLINKDILRSSGSDPKIAKLLKTRERLLDNGNLSIHDFDREGRIKNKKKYQGLSLIDQWNGWIENSYERDGVIITNYRNVIYGGTMDDPPSSALFPETKSPEPETKSPETLISEGINFSEMIKGMNKEQIEILKKWMEELKTRRRQLMNEGWSSENRFGNIYKKLKVSPSDIEREKEEITFDSKGEQITGPLIRSLRRNLNAMDVWNGWVEQLEEHDGEYRTKYYNVITRESLEQAPGYKPMVHWDGDKMTEQQNYLLDRLEETMNKLESIGSQNVDEIKGVYNEMIDIWEKFTNAASIDHSSEISEYEKEFFELNAKDRFMGILGTTKGIVGEERDKKRNARRRLDNLKKPIQERDRDSEYYSERASKIYHRFKKIKTEFSDYASIDGMKGENRLLEKSGDLKSVEYPESRAREMGFPYSYGAKQSVWINAFTRLNQLKKKLIDIGGKIPDGTIGETPTPLDSQGEAQSTEANETDRELLISEINRISGALKHIVGMPKVYLEPPPGAPMGSKMRAILYWSVYLDASNNYTIHYYQNENGWRQIEKPERNKLMELEEVQRIWGPRLQKLNYVVKQDKEGVFYYENENGFITYGYPTMSYEELMQKKLEKVLEISPTYMGKDKHTLEKYDKIYYECLPNVEDILRRVTTQLSNMLKSSDVEEAPEITEVTPGITEVTPREIPVIQATPISGGGMEDNNMKGEKSNKEIEKLILSVAASSTLCINEILTSKQKSLIIGLAYANKVVKITTSLLTTVTSGGAAIIASGIATMAGFITRVMQKTIATELNNAQRSTANTGASRKTSLQSDTLVEHRIMMAMLVKQMDDKQEFEDFFFMKLCDLCVKGGAMLNDMWWGRKGQDDFRGNDPRSAPGSAEKEFYDRLWLFARSFMKLSRDDKKKLMKESAQELEIDYDNIRSQMNSILGTNQKYNTTTYILSKSFSEELVKLLGEKVTGIFDDEVKKTIQDVGKPLSSIKLNPESVLDSIKSANKYCNDTAKGCPVNAKVKVGALEGVVVDKDKIRSQHQGIFDTLKRHYGELTEPGPDAGIFVALYSNDEQKLPLPVTINRDSQPGDAQKFFEAIKIGGPDPSNYIYVFSPEQVLNVEALKNAGLDTIKGELSSILN